MNKLAITALFTLIALAACTPNDEQTPQIAGSERQALEQAKGVESYMVDDASHLNPAWIVGKKKIGVSAGASAPEVLVQEVITKLQALGAIEVTELHGVVENVVFQLPKNLTAAASRAS